LRDFLPPACPRIGKVAGTNSEALFVIGEFGLLKLSKYALTEKTLLILFS